jgi:hypothetical protein
MDRDGSVGGESDFLGFRVQQITEADIVKWQEKLARVLRSGDHLTILNCMASIEAMECWLQEKQNQDKKVLPFQKE